MKRLPLLGVLGTILFLTIILDLKCQELPPDVINDVLSIIYNTPITLHDCKKTRVCEANLRYTLYNPEYQTGVVVHSMNYHVVNPNYRLVIIIHGWLQNGVQPWVLQMKDVYLKKESANVLAIDWSPYAAVNYAASYCYVPLVGVHVGNLIFNLTVAAAAQLENTWINGFSLGAHIAGFAGQQIRNRTCGNKVARINGLDASRTGYLNLPIDKRLDKSDATFVQGIHTSNNQFGYTHPYAKVDIHVNYNLLSGCGVIQRGCPFNPGVPKNSSTGLEELLPYFFCNHIRAVVYYTESIHSKNFIGVSCSSCKKFGSGCCRNSPLVIMGEHCPSNVSGIYYLNTNAKCPYARGFEGTR